MAPKKGSIPWNKGKTMSPEICEANRQSHLGKKLPQITKDNMSIAHLGNKSNTGRHFTLEHRLNLSKSRKSKQLTENIITKVCVKCEVEKPLNEFGIIRIQNDGHDGTCLQCRRLEWAIKNKRMPNDKITELEKCGHKICKRCLLDKPLSEFPIARSHIDGHDYHCLICHAIVVKEHEQTRVAYHDNYRSAHKEETSKYHREQNRQIKQLVLTHYGNGKCACVRCGFDDIRALSIDHINGGGTKHRKEINLGTGGGLNMYNWLINNNYPEGFRTLCLNCQIIVEFEKRELKRNEHNIKEANF
jgi:hypothetical protein